MIEVSHFEEVVQINMGRDIDGQAPYQVAAYLIDGLLIDTGCKHAAEELALFLEGQHLKFAVNTHHHEDHIGGNSKLLNKFGIRILASLQSVPLIAKVPNLYPIRELAWGCPEPTRVECLPQRIETDHFHFEVVDTPGHCPGHVALVELTRGWCFSGDLFVLPEPKLFRPSEEDLADTVRSMERLVDLKTDRLVLFTSFGGVVLDGRAALRSCVKRYQDLSCRARQLQQLGLSIAAIRDELFGGESPIAEITRGDMSSEHFVRALLSAGI